MQLVVIVYPQMYVNVTLDGLVIIVVHQFCLYGYCCELNSCLVGEETTVHNHYVHMFVYMVNVVVLIIVLAMEVGLVIIALNLFVWKTVII